MPKCTLLFQWFRLFVIKTQFYSPLRTLYLFIYLSAYRGLRLFLRILPNFKELWIRTDHHDNPVNKWTPGLSDIDLTIEFSSDAEDKVPERQMAIAFKCVQWLQFFLPFLGELECMTTAEMERHARFLGDPLGWKKQFLCWGEKKWLMRTPLRSVDGVETPLRNARFFFLRHLWVTLPRYIEGTSKFNQLNKTLWAYETRDQLNPSKSILKCQDALKTEFEKNHTRLKLPIRNLKTKDKGVSDLRHDLSRIVASLPTKAVVVSWPSFNACWKHYVGVVFCSLDKEEELALYIKKFLDVLEEYRPLFPEILADPPLRAPFFLSKEMFSEFCKLQPWEAIMFHQHGWKSEDHLLPSLSVSSENLHQYVGADLPNIILEKNETCGLKKSYQPRHLEQIKFKLAAYKRFYLEGTTKIGKNGEPFSSPISTELKHLELLWESFEKMTPMKIPQAHTTCD